jgi:hypothetical protein
MTGAMTAPMWRVGADVNALAVPSGQEITLQDIFWEEGDGAELVLRLRFIAPQIARATGTVDYDMAAKDMLYLCEHFVLPQIESGEDKPDQIIVSLSDIEVPFGEANLDATQFFEAYRIEGGACIWEIF